MFHANFWFSRMWLVVTCVRRNSQERHVTALHRGRRISPYRQQVSSFGVTALTLLGGLQGPVQRTLRLTFPKQVFRLYCMEAEVRRLEENWGRDKMAGMDMGGTGWRRGKEREQVGKGWM